MHVDVADAKEAHSHHSEKKESASGGGHGRESTSNAVSIEDVTLPRSIITRLAKGMLPPNTQIQSNAVLGICKGATVFISHLANQWVSSVGPIK